MSDSALADTKRPTQQQQQQQQQQQETNKKQKQKKKKQYHNKKGKKRPFRGPGPQGPDYLPQDRWVHYDTEPIPSDPGPECTRIDGSLLEGGGQILRNSMAYATLFKFDVKISKIRGGRHKPGLRAQHLTGLRLVACMSGPDARLHGGAVESGEVFYSPGSGVGNVPEDFDLKYYYADPKTAGSVQLLIQVALPVLLFAPKQLSLLLKGGTHTTHCPTLTYLQHVFIPVFHAKFNTNCIELTAEKLGWFPRGRGSIRLTAKPVTELKSFDMVEQGKITQLIARVIVGGKNNSIDANQDLYDLKQLSGWVQEAWTNSPSMQTGMPGLAANSILELDESVDRSAMDEGAYVQIEIHTDTDCVLTRAILINKPKKKQPLKPDVIQKQLQEGVAELLEDWQRGICVGEYLQDQLIIFMALARGTSRMLTKEISLHTETAMVFATKLAQATFEVIPVPNSTNCIIECTGVGFNYATTATA
jgi:RNA 3'-terminal phosphate cyclase (ATP)